MRIRAVHLTLASAPRQSGCVLQAGARSAEEQLRAQRAADGAEEVAAAAGQRPAMPLEAPGGDAAAAEALLAAEAMLAANPDLAAARCSRVEVSKLLLGTRAACWTEEEGCCGVAPGTWARAPETAHRNPGARPWRCKTQEVARAL